MPETIVRMSFANIGDYNRSNDGFMVTGRIVPKYANDEWTYSEEKFAEPYFKKYADEEIDFSYIEDADKVVFLGYDGIDCIGRIRLRANWNGFAMIEDIGIANSHRRRGVGAALLAQATEWARQNGYCGLMLETQDVNVSACRFYASNGFAIGGVDTRLYANFPTANEKAIFWYRHF